MTYSKSKHNACPVCGLPRGKGKYEFAHGKCAEEMARDPKKYQTSKKRHSYKQAAKLYQQGKLQKWMYS